MKTILPWLLVVLASGGAVFFYQSNQTKTTELALLRQQTQEVETLRAENEALKKSQIAPEELARLNESKDELLRLRNEVRQLRVDKTQLNQQAQAAKTAAEQAQAAATQAQETAIKKAAEQQAAVTAALQAAASDPAIVGACIGNLRAIDSIKRQWAVDHQKPANAIPSDKEIATYIQGGVMPTCPGSGKYTIGDLTVSPTCSVASHVLPPPQ